MVRGRRGGQAERGDLGVALENGRWSEPFEMVREPEIATYNPVLFYSKDRTLWLYYKFGPHPSQLERGPHVQP